MRDWQTRRWPLPWHESWVGQLRDMERSDGNLGQRSALTVRRKTARARHSLWAT